jgi:negative elongation factor C/D
MSDTSQSTSFAETRDILSSTDYLLEPEIFKTLPKYVRLGGFPEEAIRLLSQNYRGYPQMCNLVVSWLKLCGKSEDDIKNIQEVYLRDLALNQFDPEIADNAFIHREATPDWLEQMTKLSRWRSLLCELSEKYPNCMLLNFAIRKISDAGYQSEIATITSASAYIDVFNRVLLDKLRYILTEQNDEKFESAIKDFAKLVCSTNYTYLYTQALFYSLRLEKKGYLLEYISHTVKGAAKQLSRNVDRLHLILTGTARYPAVALALVSILSSGRLAPSDVDHLYSQYSSDDPPPISLVRLPELFELFIKLLFNHNKPLSNSSHKSKYIYVLALMGSVCQNNDRVDLERTTKALETVIAVCMKNDVRLVVEFARRAEVRVLIFSDYTLWQIPVELRNFCTGG